MSACDHCAECNAQFLNEDGVLDSVLIGDDYICENCATPSEWEAAKADEAAMIQEGFEHLPEFQSAASVQDIPFHYDIGQHDDEDKKPVSVFIENEFIIEVPTNLDSDEEDRFITAEAIRLVKNAIKGKALRISWNESQLVDEDY